MNMNKKIVKHTGLAVIAALMTIVIAILIGNSMCVVKQDQYVLVKRLGRVEKILNTPGLYFINPIFDRTEDLPKSDQLYDLAASDVITSDKKSMIANCYTVWRITNPLKYYQTLKTISNAEGRIDVAVYNSMKNVISSLTQEEIIQGKDGSLAGAIMDRIKDTENEYGIKIVSVEMKLLDLPDDNKASVNERMISERNKIAAQYKAEGEAEAKKIRNEVDYQVRVVISTAEKEAKSIIAEGEAEYMRIIQEAYGDPSRKDFYEFLRGLDATKASLPNGTMLIIDDEYSIIGNLKDQKEESTEVTDNKE